MYDIQTFAFKPNLCTFWMQYECSLVMCMFTLHLYNYLQCFNIPWAAFGSSVRTSVQSNFLLILHYVLDCCLADTLILLLFTLKILRTIVVNKLEKKNTPTPKKHRGFNLLTKAVSYLSLHYLKKKTYHNLNRHH